MTHNNPGRPRRHQSSSARPTPADPSPGGAVPGAAEEPDARSSDPAQRVGAPALAGPVRSDIERVDEHKSGSLETVPHTTPVPGLASFSERADADRGNTGDAP
jgi:hypothetical protein